jgi:hypothetical protein
MMTWLIENWMVVFGLAVAVIIAVLVVYRFFGLPTDKQVEKIKEWLIWACVEAEKALQSGTGQLKLRQVYDMFCAVPAFSWVAKVISFDVFSEWVSDALITVKEMLVNNEALSTYVYGDNADAEIKKIKEQLERQQ